MKRRRALQSMLAAPAAAALPLSAPAQQAPPGEEIPKLAMATADSAADPAPRFFTPPQFAALERLAAVVMPSGTLPGAREARAAAFLDFLLGQSAAARQSLYREGLDQLNEDASRRFGKPFAQIDAAESDALLAPLRQAWTHGGPSDRFAGFLHEAKHDILIATFNSREFVTAGSRRSRGAAGLGSYWHVAE